MTAYDAFVSYARSDASVVDDLYRRLSKFRTPGTLSKAYAHKGLPRALKVFLDRKSLQIGGAIPDRLANAIDASNFLIVVCSEASAASYWVNEEVKAFLADKPHTAILPVFVRSSKYQDLADLLPPALLDLGNQLPLGADLLVDGGAESVSHKVIGALLGVPQDEVAREQERADKSRRRLERLALGAIVVLSTGTALGFWGAYSEAKRAETAVEVSLTSVDSSIPFSTTLLKQGRIRVSEAQLVDGSVDRLVAQYKKEGLDRLEEVRFVLGQVLISAAQLSEAGGDRTARWERARLSTEMLSPFVADEGGLGIRVFCEAAIEEGRAAIDVGGIRASLPALEDCRDLSGIWLTDTGIDAETRQSLAVSHLRSGLVMAGQDLVKGEYSKALEAASDTLADPTNRALSSSNAAQIQGEAAQLRAATLLTLEEYSDARNALAEAATAYRIAGVADLDLAGLVTTRLWVEAHATGDFKTAEVRLTEQLMALEEALQADRGRRGLNLLISDVYLSLSDVQQSQLGPLGEDATDLGIAIVKESFTAAGDALQDLLEFDRENSIYRLKEAERLTRFADFLFRIGESQDRHEACGGPCMEAAYQLFLAAHNQITAAEPLSPASLRYRADVELRLARAARFIDSGDAADWIDTAWQSHDLLAERSSASRIIQALKARLNDESGDQALEMGQYDEAVRLFAAALEAAEAAASNEPDWMIIQRDLGWARYRYADALLQSGDTVSGRQQLSIACQSFAGHEAAASWLMTRDKTDVRALAVREGVACD